jgi:hypothetical protein
VNVERLTIIFLEVGDAEQKDKESSNQF